MVSVDPKWITPLFQSSVLTAVRPGVAVDMTSGSLQGSLEFLHRGSPLTPLDPEHCPAFGPEDQIKPKAA